MLSSSCPGDFVRSGSLCPGTVLALKALKGSDPTKAPMESGPGVCYASWRCCNTRTDLKMASIRFLQALAEGNPRHSGETSELIKSNPVIHVDLGPVTRGQQHLKTSVPTL